MSREIVAVGGERTRILHLFSDSLPQTIRFTARPADSDDPPAGTVEVSRRRWFVPQPPSFWPLAQQQAFHKGFADVDYAIYVTPERDTTIAFQTHHLRSKHLVGILGGVVLLAILSAVLVPLLLS